MSARRETGATTVSATALLAARAGVSVFVTGGIGGVHRGGEASMDVSADLTELGKTPVAVFCAGAKSVLDIPRTLEFLETQGVAVVGYGVKEFPAFFSRSSGCDAPHYAASPEDAAAPQERSGSPRAAAPFLSFFPADASPLRFSVKRTIERGTIEVSLESFRRAGSGWWGRAREGGAARRRRGGEN